MKSDFGIKSSNKRGYGLTYQEGSIKLFNYYLDTIFLNGLNVIA